MKKGERMKNTVPKYEEELARLQLEDRKKKEKLKEDGGYDLSETTGCIAFLILHWTNLLAGFVIGGVAMMAVKECSRLANKH